jgi:hypothetical protein
MLLVPVRGQAPTAPGAPELPEIRDIAPPVDVFPYPPWMVATAALLAAIILGVIIWLIVRWVRSRPAPPPPTPRAIALRELERLRGDVDRLEPYAFSIAVSDVLRRFIGAQYGLHAQQQTSPEFLAAIGTSTRFSADDQQLLGGFLERCDLIKFARIDASSDESRELLGRAVAFVQGGRA